MAKLVRLASQSLAGKSLILAAIFMVVPLILYGRFEAADSERQAFLLRTLQMQGRLAAQALEPVLGRAGGRTPLEAAKALQGMANEQVHIKLLLRPAGRDNAFFLVAASPAIETTALDQERQNLQQTGVLTRLDESCAGDRPLALRYAGVSGHPELLTSMSPLHAATGCWVILTSYATDDLAGATLARPFAEAPEVQLAMVFYALMAVLIAMAVTGTLLDLRAFTRLARRIRQGHATAEQSFAAVAAIPELLPVAREFDHMVATLDASARNLREAAEDTAHAFKAPIAAITQGLEPVRSVAKDDERARQALLTIEQALARLGTLVNATRRLDETAADLMHAKLQRINLARLAAQMAEAYDRIHAPKVRVIANSNGPAWVEATEESLETVLENLLDNAVTFSPPGGRIRISVDGASGRLRMSVEDEGPGVPPDNLSGIFRRHYSSRPAPADGEARDHYGIGLAVVRRNVELLGGKVTAENVPGAGLRVTIILPAA
jgi:two-component system, OmpR family, sensor histidine kinase ChvG